MKFKIILTLLFLSSFNAFSQSVSLKEFYAVIRRIPIEKNKSVTYYLEKNSEDKNIQLLKEQGQLQQTNKPYKNVILYIFIIALAVLLILVGFSFCRYCIKCKKDKELKAKQDEIDRQNIQLKHLGDEKEWLIKEIHHRVKNNLQIVISLLNTQSAYLQNEDALQAIQNSQHRMHAMSIIHQKLYQTENLSGIDMSWYIQELVNYLKDSFDTENKIKFNLEIQPIELDIAQAIPLGLIMNEAITNAIKYAFPDRKGIIDIELKEIANLKNKLSIADNGVGLQPEFHNLERDSLGMSLMMGLTEQLDGIFKINSERGVLITIEFTKKEAEI